MASALGGSITQIGTSEMRESDGGEDDGEEVPSPRKKERKRWGVWADGREKKCDESMDEELEADAFNGTEKKKTGDLFPSVFPSFSLLVRRKKTWGAPRSSESQKMNKALSLSLFPIYNTISISLPNFLSPSCSFLRSLSTPSPCFFDDSFPFHCRSSSFFGRLSLSLSARFCSG